MHAVVFSGGGAKGIYQAYEFVSQLNEGMTPPDIVYGTSVGAVNAAGYAYCGTQLLDLWLSIKDKSDIIKLNWNIWSAKGIYNTRPLRNLLKRKICGQPRCRAVACFVDLITQEITYVYNNTVPLNDYLDAVQASATIPFAMSPFGSKVDGGVREVTPLLRAIRDGADTITVFLCNPYSKIPIQDNWGMPSHFLPSIGIGIRSIEIMEQEIFVNDIETCLYYNQLPGKKKINLQVYCPRVEDMFIKTLDFDSAKFRSVIEEKIRMTQAISTSISTISKKVA